MVTSFALTSNPSVLWPAASPLLMELGASPCAVHMNNIVNNANWISFQIICKIYAQLSMVKPVRRRGAELPMENTRPGELTTFTFSKVPEILTLQKQRSHTCQYIYSFTCEGIWTERRKIGYRLHHGVRLGRATVYPKTVPVERASTVERMAVAIDLRKSK
jgi:hypothetical protein